MLFFEKEMKNCFTSSSSTISSEIHIAPLVGEGTAEEDVGGEGLGLVLVVVAGAEEVTGGRGGQQGEDGNEELRGESVRKGLLKCDLCPFFRFQTKGFRQTSIDG